jgi:DNA repair protein RadC
MATEEPALSDAELVAALFALGRPGTAHVSRAQTILQRLGGLAALSEAARLGRRAPAGLEEDEARRLAAAAELARRLARAELPERLSFDGAAALVRYLHLHFFAPDQEVLGAVFLDLKSRILAAEEIFRGTDSRIAVDERTLLRRALLLGASGILAFHTHPSGDPTPSREDLSFTRHLARACRQVGLALNDHLIVVGPNRWASLRGHRGLHLDGSVVKESPPTPPNRRLPQPRQV